MTKRSDRFFKDDRPYDPERNLFGRDRDRVIYSSAFRRLAGVTQVVHVEESYVFHNRLTHSLKVAQIGRRLSEKLIARYDEETLEAVGGIDPEVVETAALTHDIGHPPFGHTAEAELQKLLKENDVPDSFEGNPQSFRIVTNVCVRLPEHRGLNLTRASLDAILKYPWGRDYSGESSRSFKWGYYKSEEQFFKFARQLVSKDDEMQSAEAAIMDWADDVSYAVHDVEDFYKSGFIPLDRLVRKKKDKKGTRERYRFLEWAAEYDSLRKSRTGLGREEQDEILDKERRKKQEKIDWWSNFFERLGEVAAPPLEEPFDSRLDQRAALNKFSAFLIGRYSSNDAVALNTTKGKPFVLIDETVRKEVALLKSLMDYYVYQDPALVAQQVGYKGVIRTIFSILLDALKPMSEANFPGVIPKPFREDAERTNRAYTGKEAERERARLAVDMIVNMTDRQALMLYQRFVGTLPGSIMEPIVR